jgi:hypothetical protein
MKIAVFCDVTPCSFVCSHRRFGGPDSFIFYSTVLGNNQIALSVILVAVNKLKEWKLIDLLSDHCKREQRKEGRVRLERDVM